MKLELVSEQSMNEENPNYYLYIDGKYVQGSYTKDLAEAQRTYERIMENPTMAFNVKKVLQSEEIDVSLAH